MSSGIRLLRNSLFLTIFVLLASCEQSGQGSAELSEELNNKELNKELNQEATIDDASLLELSASEMVPLLKTGSVSVEAYHRVLLNQAERHSDRLNAFITLDPNSVLEAARKADELVIPGAPGGIPEEVYRAAIDSARPGLQANYAAYFEDNQLAAMIFPATASAAPLATPDNPMEVVIDGETVSIFINDHNSGPGALAGQPGVVIPVAMNSAGLPLAVSLDGKRDQDRQLLAVAKAIAALVEPLPAPVFAD